MKKTATIPIIIIVVAVSAIVYSVLIHRRHDTGNIRLSGNIEVTTVDLSFKVPGRVRERLLDEGEPVSPGQVVARLDSEELASEAAGRQAEVEVARAALAELEAGSREEEIAQAEAALQRVKAEADRVATDYRRQQALYDREVISKRELDTSRAAYESSRATVKEAREHLALLRKGPRRETINQARARLRDAEALLDLAKTRLGYATLISSVKGVVLSKNVEPGEQVAAGTPVVTVGVLDEVWVRAYVSETDLGKIKLGQQATVATDTYPGRKYRGQVSFISSEAEFTPKNVQTEKERVKLVYRVKVTVPNPRMELKPGMPADVEITPAKGNGQKAKGA